ncbi:hypothetical protein ACFQZ4_49140 [Catellatospora coxensis]
MGTLRRRPILRALARPCAVLASLLGTAVLAAPAAADPIGPSVPVMGIKSVGDVVATRDTLSVEDVVLDIGFLGTQQIRFRFDLVNGTQQGDPINFLADQTDPACQTLGSAPATTVECAYTRQVVAGQVEQFSFQHRTSRPGPVGFLGPDDRVRR